jgi:hypothetical protein
MVGDVAENIAEPGKRVDVHQFVGCDEAAPHRRCSLRCRSRRRSGCYVRSRIPAATSRCRWCHGQIAVPAIARERRPVLQRISNRLSDSIFGNTCSRITTRDTGRSTLFWDAADSDPALHGCIVRSDHFGKQQSLSGKGKDDRADRRIAPSIRTSSARTDPRRSGR